MKTTPTNLLFAAFSQTKIVLLLTRFCVQTTGRQEVGGELDVHVAEEEQDVLSLPPSPDAHFQASASRKLLIHLDQSEAPEPGLPVRQNRSFVKQNSLDWTIQVKCAAEKCSCLLLLQYYLCFQLLISSSGLPEVNFISFSAERAVKCQFVSVPGGLIQHSLHLIDLISTEVDHSEVDPAVLSKAHFSKSKI